MGEGEGGAKKPHPTFFSGFKTLGHCFCFSLAYTLFEHDLNTETRPEDYNSTNVLCGSNKPGKDTQKMHLLLLLLFYNSDVVVFIFLYKQTIGQIDVRFF